MKPRLLLPLLILLTGVISCTNKEKSFTVLGQIANTPPQDVFLEELNINEVQIIDSTRTDEQGKFELSGAAGEAGLYRLRFAQKQFILLSVDKGTLKVTGDWNNLSAYEVAGSEASSSLRQFLITVREHLRDFNTMSVVLDTLQVRGTDSTARARLASAKEDLKRMNDDFTRYVEHYCDTTKYLPNAIFAVNMLNPAVEKDFLESFSQSLYRRFPNSTMAKALGSKLDQMLAAQGQSARAGIQPGTQAPEIQLTTPEGKQVALSSFKGKYVLVDFWASWCGPCRGENPNVVAAYNKFKNRNFTILGVSLDSDKEKWMEAIEKDKLSWTHISDLHGWESAAAVTYQVESIPTNFLVDPNGRIIARDLKGEALESKLEELLK